MKPSRLLLVLSLLSLPVQAYETGPHADEERLTPQIDPALTLAAVWQAALAQAPGRDVAAAAQREASALDRHARRWVPQPASLLLRQQSAYSRGDQARETEAGIDFALWNWNERRASAGVAVSARQHSEELVHLQSWTVAGQVRESLWRVQLARTRVAEGERVLALARELLGAVDRRIAAGDLAERERLGAQAWVAESELALHEANTELADAFFGYRTITGRDALPAQAEETLVDETATDNPDVLAARREVERLYNTSVLVKAQGVGAPRLQISSLSQSDGANDIDSVNATLVLPLGGGRAQAARVSTAELAAAQAERSLQLALQDQRLLRHEAEHSLHAAEAALQITRSQAERAVTERRLAVRAFELGEMDLPERLQIEARSARAEAELAFREQDLGRARARYNQAMGDLP